MVGIVGAALELSLGRQAVLSDGWVRISQLRAFVPLDLSSGHVCRPHHGSRVYIMHGCCNDAAGRGDSQTAAVLLMLFVRLCRHGSRLLILRPSLLVEELPFRS